MSKGGKPSPPLRQEGRRAEAGPLESAAAQARAGGGAGAVDSHHPGRRRLERNALPSSLLPTAHHCFPLDKRGGEPADLRAGHTVPGVSPAAMPSWAEEGQGMTLAASGLISPARLCVPSAIVRVTIPITPLTLPKSSHAP